MGRLVRCRGGEKGKGGEKKKGHQIPRGEEREKKNGSNLQKKGATFRGRAVVWWVPSPPVSLAPSFLREISLLGVVVVVKLNISNLGLTKYQAESFKNRCLPDLVPFNLIFFW